MYGMNKVVKSYVILPAEREIMGAIIDRRTLAGKHRRKKVADHYKEIAIMLHEWSELGVSQEDQANLLNFRGLTTLRGTQFNQAMISRILKRAEEYDMIPAPT